MDDLTDLEKIKISQSTSKESFLGEIWKPVAGHEGWYEVSNYGRIKSLHREIIRSDGQFQPYHEKILKQNTNSDGYKVIKLVKYSCNRISYKVHRLVALSFVDNPLSLPQVNHKKEIKSLNWADELEWMTLKDNCNYGTRNKRMRETSTNGKLSKPIVQLTIEGEFVKRWESAHEARRNGFCNKQISKIVRNEVKNPNHKNYKWIFECDWLKTNNNN